MIKKFLYASISRYFWLVPFCAFLVGYFACYLYLAKTEVIVPSIMGKSLYDGLVLLSAKRLSMRIQAEREDQMFPAGTILDQFPKPDRFIRVNQTVYIVVSKLPAPKKIPNMIGMTEAALKKTSKEQGLDAACFFVPSSSEAGRCFAHYPCYGDVNDSDKIIAFFPFSDSEQLFLMPNIIGYSLEQVKNAFEKEKVVLEVFHNKSGDDSVHNCSRCIVGKQYPLAGTVVKRAEQQVVVQVQVREKNSE